MLQRAFASIQGQTHQAAAVSIGVDVHRDGAPLTRQRALMSANTEWVAFLDDDDEFRPQHLEKLIKFASDMDADYVYSWFDTHPLGLDPFPITHFTLPWDPAQPRHTTITTLVKTDLAKSVGFIRPEDMELKDGVIIGEDWAFTLGCIAAGAKIEHLIEKTWIWHHHGRNTSGLPTRW